jgi:GNAT superfamily N-acetyltransferase
MQLRFEPSEIARFGHRMARLRIEADESATGPEILDMCQAARIDMLTLRIPTHRLRLAQDLEAHGFRLMDCLVYYNVSTIDTPAAEPRGFAIREVDVVDAQDVRDVARACFADYYSHYHADPRLDRDKVADGFVDWAGRSCTDRGVATTVFLPIVSDRIAGFATMRRNSETEGEGVLFGVHPDFAGLGIYGVLIDRGKQWCRENGMTQMVVSTQIDNLRVQRSWTNRGFRLFQSYFTFHRWFV